jgi:hypothetical protein
MNGTDGDAQIYANVAITLAGPSNGSVVANTLGANTVSFSVAPTLTGNTSATLTYQWQSNDNIGGSWINVADNTPANTTYTGETAATLVVTPTFTDANNYVFRVIVTAADQGVTATSANGQITVL